MNINDISTQLLFSTVPILCETDTGMKTGTGFFYTCKLDEDTRIPFLVTNFHVVENVNHGFFEINVAENGLPSKKTIKVEFDSGFASDKRLGDLDLVAIPVAPVFNALTKSGNAPFYRSIENDMIPELETIEQLTALEDITFIGYPSGIYDSANKTPVIRKGITATPIWNNYQDKEEFLIDASVFPGSSGSPAFIFNQGTYPTSDGISIGSRLIFTGIVTGTIRRNGEECIDLGIVIKSSAMGKEIEKLAKTLLGR